jgi:hypothetical protein
MWMRNVLTWFTAAALGLTALSASSNRQELAPPRPKP